MMYDAHADLLRAQSGFVCSISDTHNLWPHIESDVSSILPLPVTQWVLPRAEGDDASSSQTLVMPSLPITFENGRCEFDSAPAQWYRNPHVHMILLRFATQSAYAAERIVLKTWVEERIANGDEYIALLCPQHQVPTRLGPIARVVQRVSRVQMSPQDSLGDASQARLLEKIRSDIFPSDASHRLLRLDFDEQAVRRGARRDFQPLSSESEEALSGQWSALRARLHSFCYSALTKRVTAYQAAINAYYAARYRTDKRQKGVVGMPWAGGSILGWLTGSAAAQNDMSGPWSFSSFFLLKEGLAFVFTQVRLLQQALRVYDELESTFLVVSTPPSGLPISLAPIGLFTTSQVGNTCSESMRVVPGLALLAPFLGAPGAVTGLQIPLDARARAVVESNGTGGDSGVVAKEAISLRLWRSILDDAERERWSVVAQGQHSADLPDSIKSLPPHFLDTADGAFVVIRTMLAEGTLSAFDFRRYLFCRQAGLLTMMRRGAELTIRSREYLQVASDILGLLVVCCTVSRPIACAWLLCTALDLLETITKAGPLAYAHDLDIQPESDVEHPEVLSNNVGDHVNFSPSRTKNGAVEQKVKVECIASITLSPTPGMHNRRARASSSLADADLLVKDGTPSHASRWKHGQEALNRRDTVAEANELVPSGHIPRPSMPVLPEDADASAASTYDTHDIFMTGMTAHQYAAAGGTMETVSKLLAIVSEADAPLDTTAGISTSAGDLQVSAELVFTEPPADLNSSTISINQELDDVTLRRRSIQGAGKTREFGRQRRDAPSNEAADIILSARMAELYGVACSGLVELMRLHSSKSVKVSLFMPDPSLLGPTCGLPAAGQVSAAAGWVPCGAHSASALAVYQAMSSLQPGTVMPGAPLVRLQLSLWYAAAHYHAAAGHMRCAIELDIRRACALVQHGRASAALPLLLDLHDQTSEVGGAIPKAQCLAAAAVAAACIGNPILPSLLWQLMHPSSIEASKCVWAASALQYCASWRVPEHLKLAYPSIVKLSDPAGGLHAIWGSQSAQVMTMSEGYNAVTHSVQTAWIAASYAAALKDAVKLGSAEMSVLPARPILTTAVSLVGPSLDVDESNMGKQAAALECILTPRPILIGAPVTVTVYITSSLSVPLEVAGVSVDILSLRNEGSSFHATRSHPVPNGHAVDPASLHIHAGGCSPAFEAGASLWFATGPVRSGPYSARDGAGSAVAHAVGVGQTTALRASLHEDVRQDSRPRKSRRSAELDRPSTLRIPAQAKQRLPLVTFCTGSGNALAEWQDCQESKDESEVKDRQCSTLCLEYSVAHASRTPFIGMRTNPQPPCSTIVLCPGVTTIQFILPNIDAVGRVTAGSVHILLGREARSTIVKDSQPTVFFGYELEQLVTVAQVADMIENNLPRARQDFKIAKDTDTWYTADQAYDSLMDLGNRSDAIDAMTRPVISTNEQASADTGSAEFATDYERSVDGSVERRVSGTAQTPVPRTIGRHGSCLGPAVMGTIFPFLGPKMQCRIDDNASERRTVARTAPAWLSFVQGMRFLACARVVKHADLGQQSEIEQLGPTESLPFALKTPSAYFPLGVARARSVSKGSAVQAPLDSENEVDEAPPNGNEKRNAQAQSQAKNGLIVQSNADEHDLLLPWMSLARSLPVQRATSDAMSSFRVRDAAHRSGLCFPSPNVLAPHFTSIVSACSELLKMLSGTPPTIDCPSIWLEQLDSAFDCASGIPQEYPPPLHVWLRSRAASIDPVIQMQGIADEEKPLVTGNSSTLSLLCTRGRGAPGCLDAGSIRLFLDLPPDVQLTCNPDRPGECSSVELGIVSRVLSHADITRCGTQESACLASCGTPLAVTSHVATSHENGAKRSSTRLSVTLQASLRKEQFALIQVPVVPMDLIGKLSNSSQAAAVVFSRVTDPQARLPGYFPDGTIRSEEGTFYATDPNVDEGAMLFMSSPPLSHILRLGVCAEVIANSSPLPYSVWTMADPAIPLPVYRPMVVHGTLLPRAEVQAALRHGTLVHGDVFPGCPPDVVELLSRHCDLKRGHDSVLQGRVPGTHAVAPVIFPHTYGHLLRTSVPSTFTPPQISQLRQDQDNLLRTITRPRTFNPFDSEEELTLDEHVGRNASFQTPFDDIDALSMPSTSVAAPRMERLDAPLGLMTLDGTDDALMPVPDAHSYKRGVGLDDADDNSEDDEGDCYSPGRLHEVGVLPRIAPSSSLGFGSAVVLLQLTCFLPDSFIILDVSCMPPPGSGWSVAASTLHALRGCAVQPLTARKDDHGRRPSPTLLLALIRFRRTISASMAIKARLRLDWAVPVSPGTELNACGLHRSRSSSFASVNSLLTHTSEEASWHSVQVGRGGLPLRLISSSLVEDIQLSSLQM